GFDGLHCLLCPCDTRLIGSRYQLHTWVLTVPRHGPGAPEHCLNRVEYGPVPMVLEDAPAAFDRIVLAVIGRVIRQPDRDAILLHKLDQPLHQLGSTAVVLRAIIDIDHEGGDRAKPLPDSLPPLDEAIYETVTGHFRGDTVDKQFMQRREEDAHGGHGRQRFEIVSRRLDLG